MNNKGTIYGVISIICGLWPLAVFFATEILNYSFFLLLSTIFGLLFSLPAKKSENVTLGNIALLLNIGGLAYFLYLFLTFSGIGQSMGFMI